MKVSSIYIVLLSTEIGSQNSFMTTEGEVFLSKEAVIEKFGNHKYPDFLMYKLSDFTQAVNDDDIKINNYFIGYVEIQ